MISIDTYPNFSPHFIRELEPISKICYHQLGLYELADKLKTTCNNGGPRAVWDTWEEGDCLIQLFNKFLVQEPFTVSMNETSYAMSSLKDRKVSFFNDCYVIPHDTYEPYQFGIHKDEFFSFTGGDKFTHYYRLHYVFLCVEDGNNSYKFIPQLF